MANVKSALDLARTSGAQLGALMARGETSSLEVTRAVFAAIEACEDQSIFIQLTKARALREAGESDTLLREGRPRSALEGVPIAYKALIDLKGEVTSAASKVVLMEGVRAKEDAVVVQNLRQAGMVTIGHLNMTELAYSALGLNPHFGTPKNPSATDEPRAPGGSSSGSAVAVARGLVPIAIGSDTGGSVRVPAAFNGILGFKPSFGHFSVKGVFALSPSLDTIGVFARTMADITAIDAAMRTGHFLQPSNLKIPPMLLENIRIIVPTNVVFEGIRPAIAVLFSATIARLAAAGVQVERRVMPALDKLLALVAKHGQLSALEAYALHQTRIQAAADGAMDRRVVKRIMAAKDMLAVDYVLLQSERAALSRECLAEIGPEACIAMPTTLHVAPPIAALEADDAYFASVNMKTGANARLGNMLDWPGVSIPMGLASHQMPAGFLLSRLAGADAQLLEIAAIVEPFIRPPIDGGVA